MLAKVPIGAWWRSIREGLLRLHFYHTAQFVVAVLTIAPLNSHIMVVSIGKYKVPELFAMRKTGFFVAFQCECKGLPPPCSIETKVLEQSKAMLSQLFCFVVQAPCALESAGLATVSNQSL
jgi:hypothetical protein